MKINPNKKTLIISAIILALIGSCLLFYQSNKSNNQTDSNTEISVNNDYESFSMNKNVSILAVSPQNNKTGYKEIYIKNKNQTELMFHSDTKIELVQNNNDLFFKIDKNNSLFVFYEYTELHSTDGSKVARPLFGHVYSVDKSGNYREIYTQSNYLDKITFEENQLVIYEKTFTDDTDPRPDTLRDYTLIKKIYFEGEFIEKERTKVTSKVN